ncbi:MAG: C40 family peptidase [Cellulosilyticaceae bacterium]
MKIRTVIKAVLTTAMLTCIAIPTFAADIEGTITEDCIAKQVMQNGDINEMSIAQGERVEILGEIEEYYEVVLNENNYIVRIQKEQILIDAPQQEVKEVSQAEEMITYAEQFLGTPYRYGGNDPRTGVDCSGFTKAIFGHFGINLQRTSGGQFANNGYKVSKSELMPGDLVFYGYNGNVTHVAIYIGNSKIIHASTGNRGVVIDPLDLRGMPPFVGFKRVL